MVRMIISSFAILAGVFGATPSFAVKNDIQVTISAEIAPVFQNGELTGCALNFQAGKNDYTYFGGDLALINGSLNLYAMGGKAPFYALKLGVLRNGEQSYVAPSTAYIVSDYETNKADFQSAVNAETPGFRLFLFSAGEASISVMSKTISQDKTIRIGYTMNDGSMSSIIPISLTMKNLNFEKPSDSIIDEGAIKKWWECNLQALDAAVKRVESE